jgi:hypothetical protein
MNRTSMLIALILAGLVATGAGCVERELVITSEPSGAVVWVSDVEVGRTPLRMPFTWYGDYEFILRHEGTDTQQYDTLKTNAHLLPQVYEWPPLDLLSQMAPWTYRDVRYLHFELPPASPPTDEQLLQRAGELREENLQPPR